MSGPLRIATLLMMTATVAPARADVIETYDYAPDRIYQVRTGLGITTQIALDPDEAVTDFSTGFSSGWELTRRDNVFYLKPKNVDVDTNLVIRTATHSYLFELRVVSTNWKSLDQARRDGVQYRILFAYPADTHFAAEAVATPALQLQARLDPHRHYDFNYDVATTTHEHWLVPEAVYDDGRFTYIRLQDVEGMPTSNFPAVFRLIPATLFHLAPTPRGLTWALPGGDRWPQPATIAAHKAARKRVVVWAHRADRVRFTRLPPGWSPSGFGGRQRRP
jgi:type IV secretion system protein VirB9